MACAEYQATLLLRCLDRDEAHFRPGDGLADVLRISGIVLVPFDIGHHVGRWHQAHGMAKHLELASPMMRRINLAHRSLNTDSTRASVSEVRCGSISEVGARGTPIFLEEVRNWNSNLFFASALSGTALSTVKTPRSTTLRSSGQATHGSFVGSPGFRDVAVPSLSASAKRRSPRRGSQPRLLPGARSCLDGRRRERGRSSTWHASQT